LSWWNELVPELQADARALVASVGIVGGTARITSVRRSLAAERRLLRAAGIEPGGMVSAHHFGRAFDAEITPHSALVHAATLWRSMGHRWSPSDPVHFEG
jgi:hypothetical protein